MKKVLTLALILFTSSVNASVILGPIAAGSSAQDHFVPTWTPDQLIDQSGLSANYTSGVTDFASFTSSTLARYSTYGGNAGTNLAGVEGLGSFYFDLGDIYSVSSVATWGQDGGSATILAYDLFYSDTFGASGSRVLIGNFSAGTSPNAFAHNFTSLDARYFELDVTSNMGYSTSRMNEVVFGGTTVQAVPEPTNLALFGLGLAGLIFTRRKKA